MKKKVFIAISALILCAVIAFLVFLSLGRGGGEIGFYATVLSVEGDVITAEVTKDEASSIFSKKLPDRIVFGTTVPGADNLKAGDKIYGMYLKGTISGENVYIIDVGVISVP